MFPTKNTVAFLSRYNPNNCTALEDYLEMQCTDHGYDLEANLTLLKLYQFNPTKFRLEVSVDRIVVLCFR